MQARIVLPILIAILITLVCIVSNTWIEAVFILAIMFIAVIVFTAMMIFIDNRNNED